MPVTIGTFEMVQPDSQPEVAAKADSKKSDKSPAGALDPGELERTLREIKERAKRVRAH